VVGEIHGGVGEFIESVVLVEREDRRERPGHGGDVGSLDGVSLLMGAALLGGARLVRGQTALLVCKRCTSRRPSASLWEVAGYRA
jgi:hypothetical protein